MLYLHIACLDPPALSSHSRQLRSDQRARVTSSGLDLPVQEKVPERTLNAYLYAVPPPYSRRFSLERRALLRPRLYWICNSHQSSSSRFKPVIHMGDSGAFSGTCRAGSLRRYDFRDDTRTVHATLTPYWTFLLDLWHTQSRQPLAALYVETHANFRMTAICSTSAAIGLTPYLLYRVVIWLSPERLHE